MVNEVQIPQRILDELLNNKEIQVLATQFKAASTKLMDELQGEFKSFRIIDDNFSEKVNNYLVTVDPVITEKNAVSSKLK